MGVTSHVFETAALESGVTGPQLIYSSIGRNDPSRMEARSHSMSIIWVVVLDPLHSKDENFFPEFTINNPFETPCFVRDET